MCRIVVTIAASGLPSFTYDNASREIEDVNGQAMVRVYVSDNPHDSYPNWLRVAEHPFCNVAAITEEDCDIRKYDRSY
jgi:hypothetical protein